MINKQGYLSKDIIQFEKHSQEMYPDLFRYFESINEFGQDTIFSIRIERTFLHQWCLAALFIRALSTFQSIFILAKKGIISEAKVLLRTLTEIQYIILAIENNHELAKDYLGQEFIEYKRLFKNAKKWSDQLPKSISMEDIFERLNEVSEEIKNHNLIKFEIKTWAEKAKMLDNYETYYSLLCLPSHANINDIKTHFVLDEQGILSTFKWGPDFDKIPEVLLATIQTILKIIESIGNSFSLDVSSTIDQKAKEFKQVEHYYNKYT